MVTMSKQHHEARKLKTDLLVSLIRWGYTFLDLVAALRTFSKTCESPPYFFLDTMAINQHRFFLGSTNDQSNQADLLQGLRSSLHACGNLLLVCMAGPGCEPGWMSPAPFKRIWCLFEIYVALCSKLPIFFQFGDGDERDLRDQLNLGGGEARINGAVSAICAEHAQASVASDRAFILGVVHDEIGLGAFNDFIRKGIKREFAEISMLAAFRGGNYSA